LNGGRTTEHVIDTSQVADPVGHYSTAIRAGDLLFVSGMLSTDEHGERVGDTIEEQTSHTLRNVAAVLTAAGATMANVVKVTSYLTDYDHFDAYDAAYSEHFEDPPPARMTCVVGLRPGFLIEIDAVAYLPGSA
jgi:2-iminobutanoate/2-iminopropanoate deaminase